MRLESDWLTRGLTKEEILLVDVKTETKINTPWDAASVPRSVLHELNREKTLSALQKKTCFNPSRGGGIPLFTPKTMDTHYLPGQSRDRSCEYLSEKGPTLNPDRDAHWLVYSHRRASPFFPALKGRVTWR